jgi:hypothetical protein
VSIIASRKLTGAIVDREDYYKLSERLGRMELSAIRTLRVMQRCGAVAVFCIAFAAAWWAKDIAADQAHLGVVGAVATFLVVLSGGYGLLHHLVFK